MKIAPGVRTPRVGGYSEIGYDLTLLKSPPESVRSTKNTDFQKLTDYVRGILASGQPVPETMLQPLCKRYPGDSLRALKRVRQCYPAATRLLLENGIWRIEPVNADD